MPAVCGVLVALIPSSGKAASGLAAWWGMLDVCESVIAEQSDVPLRGYTPAPFTFGKPGVKQYAVFDPTGNLVVTAVLKGEVWVECRVGAHEGSSPETHVGHPVKDWAEAFPARFPSPKYNKAEYLLLMPGRINPLAVRCEGVDLPYQVSAVWTLVPFSGGEIELDFLGVRLDGGDVCAPKEQTHLNDPQRLVHFSPWLQVAQKRGPSSLGSFILRKESPDQVRGGTGQQC